MPRVSPRPLRIAWIGGPPKETGGVPGVATDLLYGLLRRGHEIDCYFSGDEVPLPGRLAGMQRLRCEWTDTGWQANRWYSSSRMSRSVSTNLANALGTWRLRRRMLAAHRRRPYDLAYEFAMVENLALPGQLRRRIPVVIHPETHSAGELRALIAERRLALRCQPARKLLVAAAVLSFRTVVQRRRIRGASLLVGISSVFRDHMVRDYGFPAERTVVAPNPVRIERFAELEPHGSQPPTVLVLGRIAARKGVDDVVAIAKLLRDRGERIRIRVVGGVSVWSDYTPLLEDLPPENAEYAGRIYAQQVPAEVAAADVLLQASRYEPFALTVGEALAAGVPVVATTEVGAIEGVDPAVAYVTAPGDVTAMADAVVDAVRRVQSERAQVAALARSEAARLFAPDRVGALIDAALQEMIGAPGPQAAAAGAG